jgi:Putative restriction endonuclease
MTAARKVPPRATYADLEAVPANMVAELIGGVLHVQPRPAIRHADAEGGVIGELRGPFQRGRGGPGGWWIFPEPELHFPDPTKPGEVDAVVPDVAGWRRERMPRRPDTAAIELAPDWVCEILSESNEEWDRGEKMTTYAREGVPWAWILDPVGRTLEVYRLDGERWLAAGAHRGNARVRVAPFEAIELELEALWEEP